MKSAVLLLLLATSARAGDLISPEEFETLSAGHTLHYSSSGFSFGAEQHYSDRHTVWSPTGGTCDYGYWFPKGDQICFTYETEAGPVCWVYEHRDGKVVAWQHDDPPGTPPIELDMSDTADVDCPGPRVGS